MKNDIAGQLIISGALVNQRDAAIHGKFLEYLKNNLKDVELYRIKIDGFGGAALDWRIVIRDASAIATILSLVLNFYSLSKSKESKSGVGIYIVLGSGHDRSSQFMIQGDIKNKEIIINQVVCEAQRITKSKSGQLDTDRLISETKKLKCWVKIK